ncbi:3-oxoacyl-ACP synthase [Streptomyces sp. NBC_00162]|uniref:3-oxoacyl-ACP synthase n=1 Tax=Streptomyces sp. NBC_00162 TaxID=2903629 RepID=UPI00214B561C|nr:3-oxoacyl-ACP synthase [Streptomyces sp. NBC_00162]UUU39506.1 3-oxoacyl-ACP synthase [Streptomyces sp. NBC_00162]
MNATPVHLSAPRYVLGENPADHTSMANLTARAAELRMPAKASLWGWGTIHRTGKNLETLAVESGRATLAAAGAEPGQVDALILCSTRFPGGPRTHGGFVQAVMTGLGLGDAAFTGITLNRCTNLLVGLRLAQALVASGQHHTVLVVTTDRISDEAIRMENFALFSDGSAACLVSARPYGDNAYEILGGASAQDPPSLGWSNEISSDLARVVNDRILTPLDLTLKDVDGVLHPNLFKPIVVLKERQAGFSAGQLFLDNIPRVGHCFAADPLINLVDRAEAGQLRDGGHYLLASSVPGVRVGVLLRKLSAAQQPTSDETPES